MLKAQVANVYFTAAMHGESFTELTCPHCGGDGICPHTRRTPVLAWRADRTEVRGWWTLCKTCKLKVQGKGVDTDDVVLGLTYPKSKCQRCDGIGTIDYTGDDEDEWPFADPSPESQEPQSELNAFLMNIDEE
jgi:hypothetical protein